MKRRQFLISIGRGTILTSLAAVSGILVFRDSKNTDKCTFDFICKDCRKIKSCGQPEAIIFKRNKERKSVSNG
ncbi:MAG: hypothetical protein PF485_12765 [Bacteroidales bacterium]|jgi:hypothetical protein|nr:hypothetical protein [Bacteroidales bacterium]